MRTAAARSPGLPQRELVATEHELCLLADSIVHGSAAEAATEAAPVLTAASAAGPTAATAVPMAAAVSAAPPVAAGAMGEEVQQQLHVIRREHEEEKQAVVRFRPLLAKHLHIRDGVAPHASQRTIVSREQERQVRVLALEVPAAAQPSSPCPRRAQRQALELKLGARRERVQGRSAQPASSTEAAAGSAGPSPRLRTTSPTEGKHSEPEPTPASEPGHQPTSEGGAVRGAQGAGEGGNVRALLEHAQRLQEQLEEWRPARDGAASRQPARASEAAERKWEGEPDARAAATAAPAASPPMPPSQPLPALPPPRRLPALPPLHDPRAAGALLAPPLFGVERSAAAPRAAPALTDPQLAAEAYGDSAEAATTTAPTSIDAAPRIAAAPVDVAPTALPARALPLTDLRLLHSRVTFGLDPVNARTGAFAPPAPAAHACSPSALRVTSAGGWRCGARGAACIRARRNERAAASTARPDCAHARRAQYEFFWR